MFKHNYLFIKIIEIFFFQSCSLSYNPGSYHQAFFYWMISLASYPGFYITFHGYSSYFLCMPLIYIGCCAKHWMTYQIDFTVQYVFLDYVQLNLLTLICVCVYVCVFTFNCPCLEVKSEILGANALLPPCWFWEIDMRWSGLKGSLLTLWVISSTLCLNDNEIANLMDHWGKVLAIHSDSQNSIPGSYMMEEETWLLQVHLWFPQVWSGNSVLPPDIHIHMLSMIKVTWKQAITLFTHRKINELLATLPSTT